MKNRWMMVFLFLVACPKEQVEPSPGKGKIEPGLAAKSPAPSKPAEAPAKMPAEAPKAAPGEIQVGKGENGEVKLTNHPLDNFKVEKKNGAINISNVPKPRTEEAPNAPSAATAPTTPAAPPKAPSAPPKPAAPGDAAAVSKYLKALEALQVRPGESDPNAFAQQMVTAATRGDTSGLDSLIKDLKEAQTKMNAMDVPAVAKDHHRSLQSVTKSSLDMLGVLKAAVTAGDYSRIAGIGPGAQALKREGERLRKLEEQLRLAHGLAR